MVEERDAEAGYVAGEGGQALRLRGAGQVSAASQGGHERDKQAAGAGRLVSSLPAPCETAGNGVIAYSYPISIAYSYPMTSCSAYKAGGRRRKGVGVWSDGVCLPKSLLCVMEPCFPGDG